MGSKFSESKAYTFLTILYFSWGKKTSYLISFVFAAYNYVCALNSPSTTALTTGSFAGNSWNEVPNSEQK